MSEVQICLADDVVSGKKKKSWTTAPDVKITDGGEIKRGKSRDKKEGKRRLYKRPMPTSGRGLPN